MRRPVPSINKQQIEGIRDPNQDLVIELQIEDMVTKFLITDHGIEIPKEEPTEGQQKEDK